MNFMELYNTLIPENLVKGRDMDGWRRILRQNNWKYAASGAFGTVYVHDNKNYIIKVYAGDHGYNTYLDFLEEQQGNPNVVKLKRRIFKNLVPGYGVEAVALEKLIPIRRTKATRKLFDFISDINDLFSQIDTMNNSFEDVMTKIQWSLKADGGTSVKDKLKSKQMALFIKHYRNLAETIYKLKLFMELRGEVYDFDLHDGNFMIRPSTGEVVITDPLA